MDSENVEHLLEKYWNCETSLEEEMQLREYFLTNDVPSRWKEAAELFRYFEQQKEVQLTGATGENAIGKSEAVKPAGKGVRMVYNYGRIAAGLLVMVAATYFVRQEIRKSYPSDPADTYSDPKLAFEETKKALLMISSGFGKAKKETNKINLFNEAEKKIEGKKMDDKKEKVSI